MNKAPSSILLFQEAQKRNLNPVWQTGYGFFTFNFENVLIYVFQTKTFANTQMISWLTTDKLATRQILKQNNLSNIPYLFYPTPKEFNQFITKHKKAIAKPRIGQLSQDVVLVSQNQKLTDFDLKKTLFEKYIEGDEFRVLLLNREVVAVQQKKLNPSEKFPWRKFRINLEKSKWNQEQLEIAQKIYSFIPQNILAIDFIQDKKSKNWILELNSMPGLWSFANPHLGKPINLSSQILDIIIDSQFKLSKKI